MFCEMTNLLGCREVAKLCIGGLELDPRLVRRGLDGLMGWEGDRLEEEKCACSLGIVDVLR